MDNFGLYANIKKGDRKSFDTLFKLYYKELCHYSWKFVRSKDAVEDIVQKVYIQLWMKRKHLLMNESVRGYLYKSVRNESLIYLKSTEIRKTYESAYSKDGIDQENDETAAEVFAQKVRQKLADLPEKCKEIFILSRFDGLTYDEIAGYLAISKKTVENQMVIAYKKLRELLKPELDKIKRNF